MSLSTFDSLNALDTDQVIGHLRSKEIDMADLQTIEIKCQAFSCTYSASTTSRCFPGNLNEEAVVNMFPLSIVLITHFYNNPKVKLDSKIS